MTRPASDPYRRPRMLGAVVFGYPAFALHMLLRKYGPKLLAEVEAAVERGTLAPALLVETRDMVDDIADAATLWINTQGTTSATSADGTLSRPPAETATDLWEITTTEAAERLFVGRRRIGQLIADKALDGRKVGRVWLVTVESVERHRRSVR